MCAALILPEARLETPLQRKPHPCCGHQCCTDRHHSVFPPPANTDQLNVGQGKQGRSATFRRIARYQAADEAREALKGSEVRRVGKGCVSTCKSRWVAYH